MHCDGRALVLEIRNDGIGGASMETAGSGLKGMADRAGAVALYHRRLSAARSHVCARDNPGRYHTAITRLRIMNSVQQLFGEHG